MDQSKAALPHRCRPPKDLDESSLVKLHITCVRAPGVGVFEYVYSNNLAHDANTTVTVLHR